MKQIKKYMPVATIATFLMILYFPVLKELVSDWYHDSNYSHGFLIPLVSGYFIWQKREYLIKITIKTYHVGLFVLLPGLIMYIIATASAEWFFARLSFIIVISGILLFITGKDFFKAIFFPVLFLVFMIPLPYIIYYSLTFPMQIFASKTSTMLLQLIGFPILRQGNIIHLQNYSLEVVEACSGLRSLMTLSALGAALAYFSQKTALGGIFLFLFSIPIAIGANIFRILITALGATLISPNFADGFIHEISGLMVFLVGLTSLAITGAVLNGVSQFVIQRAR